MLIFYHKNKQRILDSRFLIFTASAGSGKTFSLTVQYIALLVAKGVREFSATLAVTFTNKATGEMKNRILEQLYGIAYGLKESEGYLDNVQQELVRSYKLHLPDDEVRGLCRDALKQILHDYSRFYISTIDSFFQTVLRNMAHELGLTARLQVDISDDTVTEMAVEHLIDSLQYDDKELLPWLRDYIRTQMENGKTWDVRKALNRMAKNLFKEVYLRRPLDKRNKDYTLAHLKAFREALMTREKDIRQQLHESAMAFENILESNGVDYADLSHGNDWVKPYITRLKEGQCDGTFSPSLQKRVDDPLEFISVKQRKTITAAFQYILQGLSDALRNLRDEHTRCGSILNTIGLIMETMHPIGVMGALDAEIKRANADANRFVLAHTPILLREMIGSSDAPFVFEKSGTRFHNVMIDEFQDTSSLQWEIFRVLLMNNLAEGGMSMVVGDVKQSIYRWRNGDWRILYALSQHGLPGYVMEPRPLNVNYRSLGNIITFNNDFFVRAAQWLDGLCPDASVRLTDMYADVRQGVSQGKEGRGYVRIHIDGIEARPDSSELEDKAKKKVLEEQAKEAKAAWQATTLQEMGEQILRLHEEHGVPFTQMAILIREKKSLGPMVAYFAEHFPQLKLVSNEAFRLNYSVAVNMLVAALRYLQETKQSEPNPLPLLYLVQHYLQDVLKQGVDKEGRKDMTFVLTKPEDILPKEFLGNSSELMRLPLHQLCEHLYRLFRLHEIEGQDAYMLCFFDELQAFLADNSGDILSFLDYWDKKMQLLSIPSGAVDGITVQTIHTSKGLEYHSVFIPFLDEYIEEDKGGEVLWCTPEDAPMDYLGSLPVPQRTTLQNTNLASDYKREHDARRADALNVIYVAFTRAGSNLMVWGSVTRLQEAVVPKETSGDIVAAALGMENDVFELGMPEPYLAKKSKTKDKERGNRLAPDQKALPSLMCSFEGKTEFRQSRPAAQFVRTKGDETEEAENAKQLGYIEKGKLLHYIFSQIRKVEETESVVQDMLRQGVLRNESQVREVLSLARRGLNNPLVAEWFAGEMELYNECNVLVSVDGEVKELRPDRVMMDKERVVVLDFKFGKPHQDYNEQVKQYMDLMHQMYPEKQVEGYLWYVYKNMVERV